MKLPRRIYLIVLAIIVVGSIAFRAAITVELVSVDQSDIPGWFVIECGNPRCESVEEFHWWGHFLRIPKGGFVCTKDPVREGWYLTLIWNRSVGHLVDRADIRGAAVTYRSLCQFVGEKFFIGSQADIATSNIDTVLRDHRPDCFILSLPDGGTTALP